LHIARARARAATQAYHREPHQLHVRHHALRLAPVTHSARRLRILHLTDIQAATIGLARFP